MERLTMPGGKITHFATSEVVYTFIRDYLAQEGYAPSLNDIARGCGLGRTTVLYHLHRLKQWGLIRRAPGKARSIVLVDEARQGDPTVPPPEPIEPQPSAPLASAEGVWK